MFNFVCGYCKHVFSGYDSSIINVSEVMGCPNCGLSVRKADCDILVRPSSERYRDLDAVMSSSWFHFTFVDDWFNVVTGKGQLTPAVHVGTFDAAVERGRDAINYYDTPTNDLYEIRFKPGTKFDDLIHSDKENRWEERASDLPYDAARYVNKYESPGSISIICDPRVLEVVAVHNLPALTTPGQLATV